jgi:ATP-dependent DNA helicase RecQ
LGPRSGCLTWIAFGTGIHWQHPSSVEDYLQEFGRAGRDGKASVAVLLHDQSDSRRDIGLLRFMAGRAVKGTQLSPPDASSALNHKLAQIGQMARLAETPGCFREALVGYFTGPKRPVRRSFSTWLLEFVFADRGVQQQEVACCDACQRLLIDQKGPTAFVNHVLSE